MQTCNCETKPGDNLNCEAHYRSLPPPPYAIEYMAGLMDGEGHFGRYKMKNGRRSTYSMSIIVISNSFKPLIDKLKDTYGGHVSQQQRKDYYAITYYWRLQGRRAEALALQMKPYLTVKQEQVKKILDYEIEPRKPRRKWNDPTLLAEKAERLARAA